MNQGLRVCVLRAFLLSLVVFVPSLPALSITYFIYVNGDQLPVDGPMGRGVILYGEANPCVEGLVQGYGIEMGLALYILSELVIYFALFLYLIGGAMFFLKEMETRTLDLAFAIPFSALRFYNSYHDLTVLPQTFQQGFLFLFVVVTFAWVLLIRFYWKTFRGDAIWRSISG